MQMILFHERWAINCALDRNDPARFVPIPLGDHEMMRIPNPYGYHGDWLVIFGTKIGALESWWRDGVTKPNATIQPIRDDHRVIIKE